MQSLTEAIFQEYPPNGLFTKIHVRNLFPDLSEGAVKALIHRAMKRGEVLRLGQGYYYLSRPYQSVLPHPFVVANALHRPSYVSFESALRYHDMIPEAVAQTASVCTDRSRFFNTPLGRFEYRRVPCANLYAGVRSLRVGNDFWAYIATPLRAVADLVYERKTGLSVSDPVGFLKESMRVEEEDFEKISFEDFREITESIRNKTVRRFLYNLKQGLKK